MIKQKRKDTINFIAELITSLDDNCSSGNVTLLNKVLEEQKIYLHEDHYENAFDGALVYDKKKPGQSATLEIERNGYEVVNKKNLFITLPKNDKVQRPVKFFLCPKGQWRKYADQYYKTNMHIPKRLVLRHFW